MSDLYRPEFTDAEKAREWLETELWPNGPVCSHCGVVNEATRLEGVRSKPSKTNPQGKPVNGLYQCNACRAQFTVMVGTLYERSHIPLNKWLAATHLIMASKKGMSSLEIGRLLGISKKSAWFLTHRIRGSLRPTDTLPPLGGEGKVVEADETYIGGKELTKHANKRLNVRGGGGGKAAVVALVEREGGMRSFHLPKVDSKTLRPILTAHIERKSYLMTDESVVYTKVGREFAGHGTVIHNKGEYVRGGFCLVHEHGRGVLRDPQARHHGHVPPRVPTALVALSRRIRLPLQQPLGPRDRGSPAYAEVDQGHRRKALDLSAD